MPKVNLGRTSPEEIFGSKLKSSIIENRMACGEVAKKMGFTSRTMSSRFKNPSDMTLGQLKRFIKLTGLPEESVINYLYGKK